MQTQRFLDVWLLGLRNVATAYIRGVATCTRVSSMPRTLAYFHSN